MGGYKYINPKKMEEFVDDIKKAHYQMLLIVEPPDSQDREKLRVVKNEIKRWVVENGGETIDLEELAIDISANIDKELLGETLVEEIKVYFHRKSVEISGPAYVENADILFAPDFGSVNAIHLLKYASREIPIITVIPLEFNVSRKRVTYGKPEDEDYYPDIDVDEIVVMSIQEVIL